MRLFCEVTITVVSLILVPRKYCPHGEALTLPISSRAVLFVVYFVVSIDRR